MAALNRCALLLTVTTRALLDEHTVEQQPGQREVAQVVGAELQLEAVGGGLFRGVHHPGVVDQQVDARVGGAQRFGGGTHRLQRAQVELLYGDVGASAGRHDPRRRVVALVEVAHR